VAVFELRIISFIGQPEVIIHTKRNSLALQLHPAPDSIKASFNCVWHDVGGDNGGSMWTATYL
jgi:hypothetical protein